MANFPTSLDSFTAPTPTAPTNGPSLSATITALQQAVAALEAKVGILSSADATSHEYKLNHLTPPNAPVSYQRAANQLTTLDPNANLVNIGTGSNVMFMQYFTAAQAITTTQARFVVTVTPSTIGATGIGLYSVDASDNATLLTVITGSTWTGTGQNTVTWVTPQALVAGGRYAVGMCPTASTNVLGWQPSSTILTEYATIPRTCGLKTATAACPASVSAASLTNTNEMVYIVIL